MRRLHNKRLCAAILAVIVLLTSIPLSGLAASPVTKPAAVAESAESTQDQGTAESAQESAGESAKETQTGKESDSQSAETKTKSDDADRSGGGYYPTENGDEC